MKKGVKKRDPLCVAYHKIGDAECIAHEVCRILSEEYVRNKCTKFEKKMDRITTLAGAIARDCTELEHKIYELAKDMGDL